ncbi:MAG: hypothetical protein L0Y58_25390 [Verrucomicrobia subdivision 3 bacterium]|nr:hypothetical protein [Gemmataceae bacterium]MCI0748756.1 hypothetical protein [Limisphaerales bacterium]
MNAPKKNPLPEASAWRVEFVRLIAFPDSPAVLRDQTWWKDLTGDEPEDCVRKKDRRDDRGGFQGAWLTLSVDFQRVIWEARPPAVVDESGNFPTFDGPIRDKLEWFAALLDPWLKTSCPPLLRLAFSAKLLQPAATAKDAYRVLAAHLPMVTLDPPPNDFLLQINRRKENSDIVDGLPINRLSTWSRMNVAIVNETGKTFTWPDRCYAALELDINTAPERTGILPRDSIPRLFKELALLGIDIAEHGDNVETAECGDSP